MDANAIITELEKAKTERDAVQAKFSGTLAMVRALDKTGTLTPEQKARIEKVAPLKQRTKKGGDTPAPAPGPAATSK